MPPTRSIITFISIKVGINRNDPDQRLNVSGNIELNAHDSSGGNGGYYTAKGLIIGNAYDAGKSTTDDRNSIIWSERGLDLDFATNDTFRMKIKHDGKLLVNHTAAVGSAKAQSFTSNSDAIDIVAYSSTAANGGRLTFYRSKNATIGSNTEVADNDSLGRIDWRGYNDDGTAYNIGATIEAEVDGTVNSTTDMPSALAFKTSVDGSSSPTERLRIDSTGRVLVSGGASPSSTSLSHSLQVTASSDADAIAVIGRAADDIGEISFYEADKSTNLGEIQYRTTETNIRARSAGADINFATTTSGGSMGDRLIITAAGDVSIHSGAYDGGGTVPQLYVRGTSGRQMKIHNPNVGTCSLQMTNATTGQGEDAGTQLFTQGGNGDFWIQSAYATADIAFATKASSGGTTERLRIDSSGTLKLNQADSMIMTGADTSRLRLFGGSTNSVNNGATLSLNGVNHSAGNFADLSAATGGHIQFRIGTSEKLKITNNGHVQIISGNLEFANGSGIDFSNVPDGSRSISTDGNKFDDYEEGTWTPQVLDGNGANYTISVNSSVTRYVKIGRVVYCWYNITRTESGSKTGTLRFYASTLPFSISEAFHGGEYWVDHGSPTAGQGDIVGGVHYGTTSGVYWVLPTREIGTTSTAPNRYIDHGNWTNGRPIYGMFYYTTAT